MNGRIGGWQVRWHRVVTWLSQAFALVIVKRILNKYGYPPDLQEAAVKTVLMQAELLCKEWA